MLSALWWFLWSISWLIGPWSLTEEEQAPALHNSRLDKGGYKVWFQISRMRASPRTNRQNHSRQDADIPWSFPKQG